MELLLLHAVIISKILYPDSCYSTLCHDKFRKLLCHNTMQHEPYTTPCPFLPDIAIWRLQVNAQEASLLCASPEQAINYHLRRNRFHGSPISQGACLWITFANSKLSTLPRHNACKKIRIPCGYSNGWYRLCHELTTYLARSTSRAQGYHLLQCRKVHKARQGIGLFIDGTLYFRLVELVISWQAPSCQAFFARHWNFFGVQVRCAAVPRSLPVYAGPFPAGKMETNKSPRSCQQVFSRPSNFFWLRGADTNLWYLSRHCDNLPST